MKRIISMLGIIGIVLFAVFSIIDHIFFLDDKVYSVSVSYTHLTLPTNSRV